MTQFQIILNIISDDENDKYLKSYDPDTNTFAYTPIIDREQLDTYGNNQDSIDFTFQVSDVRNIIDTQSSYSKTITVPDTPNNRKIFSAASELNAEGSFNPKRRTICFVIVDSVIVFEGIIQLTRYNVLGVNNCQYEVLIASNTKNFKDAIGNKMLQDLPFGAIDCYWTAKGVQDTWNPTITSEVYFPLIDYGWNLKSQTLGSWPTLPLVGTAAGNQTPKGVSVFTENFYPGVYLKSYIDRIFTAAGFRYKSNFLNSDNFKKIFIPYNGTQTMLKYDINSTGTGTYAQDKYFKVGNAVGTFQMFQKSSIPHAQFSSPFYFGTTSGAIGLSGAGIGNATDPSSCWDTVHSDYANNTPGNEIFKQNFVFGLEMWATDNHTGSEVVFDMMADPNTTKIEIVLYRSFGSDTGLTPDLAYTAGDPYGGIEIQSIVLKDTTGGNVDITPTQALVQGGTKAGIYALIDFNQLNNESYCGYSAFGGMSYNYINKAAIRVSERCRINLRVTRTDTTDGGSGSSTRRFNYYQGTNCFFRNEVSLECIYGSKLDIGNIVPKNIKCIDFIKSINTMFNLYIEPSKVNPNVLIIEPRDGFYKLGNKVDWSDKIDLSQPINVNILSELTTRYTNYTYKAGSDYYNKTYKNYTNYNFGEYTYDNFNEYTTGTTVTDVVFASTINVIVPDTYGLIIPNLSTDAVSTTAYVYTGAPINQFPASDIRILYADKQHPLEPTPREVLSAEKYFLFGLPYAPYAVPAYPAPQELIIDASGKGCYPYAGTLDNLYTPSYDLSWGTPLRLYYDITGTNGLSYSQYNLINTYWNNNLGEINGRNSRLLTCSMLLTAKDINELSLSNLVYIRINHPNLGLNQGSYFKINKISGYNPSLSAPCVVEFLKSDYVPGIIGSVTPGGGGSIPVDTTVAGGSGGDMTG